MFLPNKSKSCGTLKGMPQPFFRAQSTPTGPIARGRAFYVNLSRSPDLRILSQHTAFSGNFPMTDFRLVCGLRAYSGGTVPDFHRIHYSPLSLRRYQRHSNLYSIYTLPCCRTKKYPGGLETRAPLRPQMREKGVYCFRPTPHSEPEKHKKKNALRADTKRNIKAPLQNAVRPNRKRSSGFGRMLSTAMYLA